jgi:squalene synthase HpnC
MLESDLVTSSNNLNFEHELARFGPDQAITLSLAEAQRYCSRWAKQHYENFVVASVLLPRNLRQDFHNVYTYCRWSDNLADEISDPQRSLELLDWWQAELSKCFQGHSLHPVMLALQQTICQHNLAPQPFLDLLSAFRQDQHVIRYYDDQHLHDYCRNSANPVGRIVLQLAGVAQPEAFLLSDRICTGLQLANFCQDMARDAQLGRIYAPQAGWAAHGVDEAMILRGQVTDPLRRLLAEWVAQARQELQAGWPLLELVPGWLQKDLSLFIGGGLAILSAIERREYDVWTSRPRVSKWTQLRLLCSTCLPRIGTGRR